MTVLLITLALWLLPGLLAYVIMNGRSHDWRPSGLDVTLIIPGVNILVLGLVLIIIFDEMIGGQV